MNTQIEILNGTNPANPLQSYIGELLAIEGFTFRFVEAPSSRHILLIVPNLLLTDSQKEIIRQHAKTGGALIALRPPADLAPLFGLAPAGGQRWAGYTRHPDGDLVQIHGGSDLYRLVGAEAVAPLVPDFDADLSVRAPGGSTHPSVARVEESGSRRVCFAYDLARCCVLIQQGRPDQASDGPFRNADGDWKFSQNDLFIGHLDAHRKDVPQSDLHRDLLVRSILWVTDKTKPVPRVWRFPNREPAGAMMDGDGDAAPKEIFDLAFSTCEEFGVPYSTYLMEDQFDTVTPSDARALRARGHSVGLHPWLGPFPSCAEFEAYLKDAFANFSDRYGYIPSASRNHCVIWTGWVDLPRVESEIGVRMDLNGYPGRYFQSGVQSGTLLPAKFMDARGELIDLYSQFTPVADDGWIESKNFLPALAEPQRITETRRWIERCIRYQGLFHPIFHPIRMKGMGESTLPWFRATLEYAKERGIHAWSADAWAGFNDARRTIQIQSSDSGWAIRADRSLNGATIVLPRRDDRPLLLDGAPTESNSLKTAGQDQLAIVCDLEAGQTRSLEFRSPKL